MSNIQIGLVGKIGSWGAPVLAALVLFAGPAAAQTSRPYTVDDMLRLEEIGKVRFGPDGDRLFYEHYGPFEAQSEFGRSFVRGEHRSKLYRVDLDRRVLRPRRVFDQDAASGYQLAGVSPGGRFLSVNRVSDAGYEAGVVDLEEDVVRIFDVTPDYNDVDDTHWLGGDSLLIPALQPGDAALTVALRVERVDQLVERWRQAREGAVTTASPIGSGRFADLPDNGERLVLASASDGSHQSLADGDHVVFLPSPRGEVVAALRQRRLEIDPDRPLEHGANIGAVTHELVILQGGEGVEPCMGCDVLRRSLQWSPSGRYLAFVGRRADETWDDAAYWIYDTRSLTVARQDLVGLEPYRDRAGIMLDLKAAWLDDRLAVFLTDPETSDPDIAARDRRADWHLLGVGAPVNLTAGFKDTAPELIATAPGALVLLHEGEAYAVGADGSQRLLTAAVEPAVAGWRRPSRYGRLPLTNVQPADMLILQDAVAEDSSVKQLYILDLESGETTVLALPGVEAEVLDVSAATGRAAVIEADDSGVTRLSVVEVGRATRPILEINDHLRGVAGGTPVRIDHQGEAGDERFTWLLIPPGHEDSGPLPTVVNVYPGASCREEYNRWRLNQVHALNDHILAAHGYAVLYPCVPVKYEEVPRDPLDGLVDNVFAAVEAAAAEGYVDLDRLGVKGQSYGGYTTGALIGLTDRFKGAVAQAGLYELVSKYGVFDVRRRLDMEREGLNFFGASMAETSQTGMGAPPWEDPERYRRNSPLTYVENITTPVMLIHGDLDYVDMTQAEQFFTALSRLDKDAVFVRYFGEDHVFNSPANIRDMWARIFAWYEETLGPPVEMSNDEDAD